MLVTLLGMVTLIRLLQPSKAPPNGGDAVGDRHTRQPTAVIEGSIRNAGDVVGDCVVTVFPGRKSNQLSFVFAEQNLILRRIFRIIFAHLNARQTTAAHEGSYINVCNTVGNRHTRQTAATKKGPRHNIEDTVANRHASQVTAAMEGKIPNAGNAVWYRHARQAAAFPEGPTPNAGDRFLRIGGGNRQRSRGSLFTIFDGNGVSDDFILQRIGINLIDPAE